MLPIPEYSFELSKQQFLDSICLRYSSEISKLPTTYPCGSKFDIQDSMSCKKEGFVTIRHNDLRDLTAKICILRYRSWADNYPVNWKRSKKLNCK